MDKADYIIVSGPSEQQMVEATQLLADLYVETEFTKGINIHKSEALANSYLITFTNNPDFERFKYFVNYLNYPEMTDYEAKVIGYYTLNETPDRIGHLYGKRIMLYVSDSDTEFDNVNAIFEGGDQTLKLGFALGEEYQELGFKEIEFQEPAFSKSSFKQLATISTSENIKTPRSKGCAGIIVLITAIITMTLSIVCSIY